MTYLIHYGVVVHRLPQTIFQNTYRILKPKNPLGVLASAIPDSMPVENNEVEFKFLCFEDGHSIYTNSTNLLHLFREPFSSGNKTDFIKPDVDIYEAVMEVLGSFSNGFARLWSDWENMKDDSYRKNGLSFMFQQIALAVKKKIKA